MYARSIHITAPCFLTCLVQSVYVHEYYSAFRTYFLGQNLPVCGKRVGRCAHNTVYTIDVVLTGLNFRRIIFHTNFQASIFELLQLHAYVSYPSSARAFAKKTWKTQSRRKVYEPYSLETILVRGCSRVLHNVHTHYIIVFKRQRDTIFRFEIEKKPLKIQRIKLLLLTNVTNVWIQIK